MQEKLVRVAAADSFPSRHAVRVTLPDDEVAVWHVDGRYFAVSAVCRHHHVPTLHEGEMEGLTVTCPLHGWAYSLETGEAIRGNGRLPVYTAVVRDGVVWIVLPDNVDDEQV